jgi:hypothetical protein
LPELRGAAQLSLVEQRANRLRALPLGRRPHGRRPEKGRRGCRFAARRIADPAVHRRPLRRQELHCRGRILYQYEQGTWNEWHIVLDGGIDGWLSDAQNEFAISFPVMKAKLPSEKQAALGKSFAWNETRFTVVSRTLAHYAGVEGELPFEYWDKEDVTFIDLRSTRRDFATLDYSDDTPALYIGKAVEFEELRLRNLRSFEGW